MHVRKQLRDAVAALVTGLPTTGSRVFVDRSYALDEGTETPALVIGTPSESAEPHTIDGSVARAVTVTVTAVVKSTGAVQDTCDEIASEVETALGTPGALVLGGMAREIAYAGAEYVSDASADRKVAELELSFRVELFTAPGQPDAFI